MQKMFSQPYLFTLDEHSDGISCMAKSRENLTNIFSGSFNGEVVCWNLIKRKPVFKIDAFRNQTKEICVQENTEFFLAAGDNNVVKLYDQQKTIENFKGKI